MQARSLGGGRWIAYLLLTVAKAVDHARGQAQIVLALNVAGGISVRGVLIIALDADAQRCEERMFESSANCVRGTGDPSIQVVGSIHRGRAFDPRGADQRTNEEAGFPEYRRIENRTGQEAEDIGAVSRIENVASAGISGVGCRCPARVELYESAGIDAGEAYPLGWRSHAEVDITETGLKRGTGSRGRGLGVEARLRQKRCNEQENAGKDSSHIFLLPDVLLLLRCR